MEGYGKSEMDDEMQVFAFFDLKFSEQFYEFGRDRRVCGINLIFNVDIWLNKQSVLLNDIVFVSRQQWAFPVS